MTDEHTLLTSKQVAEILQIHPTTLGNSRVSGVLLGRKAPVHKKMGRIVRYYLSVIDAWIENGEEI
jgi:predicted DNA-binding transcriptional regulator AlpA